MTEAWERSRFTATAALQPWSKRRLRPEDVTVFPWETAERHPKGHRTPSEEPTREQAYARFQQLTRTTEPDKTEVG